METVLVIGATGNIGVSAVKGALNSGRNVLAIVRNQASADKLVRHVGSAERITFAEASVTADDGVQSVVDRVRAGELPAFQHVYSCVGGEYITLPMKDITTERLRANMTAMFETAFCTLSPQYYSIGIPLLTTHNPQSPTAPHSPTSSPKRPQQHGPSARARKATSARTLSQPYPKAHFSPSR